MKKIFGFLFLTILILVVMLLPSSKQIVSQIKENPNETLIKADEIIAKKIEKKYQSEDIKDINVFKVFSSGKYMQNRTFLLKKYATDLGYYVIDYPKKEQTALILRYGKKKVVVKKDGTVTMSIFGDEWEEGIIISPSEQGTNDYFISCNDEEPLAQYDNETIFQIADSLNHLRTSKTLSEMAEKNRANFEQYLNNPEILSLQ